MDQIEGLKLIGALALGLLLVYLGTLPNRKRAKRERATDAGTTASSGDGIHHSTASGAFLWFGHSHDSKSDSNEPGGTGDAGGGWGGGDSGGDGGGGGGGD